MKCVEMMLVLSDREVNIYISVLNSSINLLTRIELFAEHLDCDLAKQFESGLSVWEGRSLI